MENGTDKTSRNRRGRPSKPEELETERELRVHFQKGKKPYQVVIDTGYNINTVKKHYGKFFQEIIDLEGPEFAQACKDRITSTCLALDTQLSKMEKMQEELEKKTPSNETQYIQLCKLRINLANSISDLHIERLNIANSPTYDDMLAALRKIGEQK